ncbi:hypothetical protein [Leucobacter komagatae]|uniref:Uncharacterized protein n=1 Tax=Leucobacter komagatae TaxID=55969 RepID=A0A0D0IW81_9MICO|nr:hypothetical protein [Leucobacter komagatae]KIP53818.1 hypothetical protein SD72_01145 [Leucobacter komagatae]
MTWKIYREALSLKLSEIELDGDLHYDAAQAALCLVDPESGEEEVLTVSLLSDGYVALPGEVFVRDYSEHSGLPTALVTAGVCELVEELSVGPFGSWVQRMRVLEAPSAHRS